MARDASYEVQVEVTPQNGCAAALGLFYSPNNWVFAELKDGQLRVYGAKETLATRAWKAGTAHLKIINRRNRVEFLASENGRDWQSLVANYDASGFNTNVCTAFRLCARRWRQAARATRASPISVTALCKWFYGTFGLMRCRRASRRVA